MNALVVFYSRTGNTKKVAEGISKILKCDIEEIRDKKDRSGAIGWLFAGKDATSRETTELGETVKDAAKYDVVIIGTPIWAFTVSPASKTYILQNRGKFKNVAFFCTEGGMGGKNAFAEMEKASGKKPLATLEIKSPEMKSGAYLEKAEKFCEAVKK